MEMPAISVIIPMYNAKRYVRECLDSFLAQTFTDFEIIVVDDCSTDSSRAIVESYAPRFNGWLTLIGTQKNSGNSGYTARNKGLNFSRGEYVYFADADDFVTKTALEELYTAAKNFDADVVYTCIRYIYEGGRVVETRPDGVGRMRRANGIVENRPVLESNAPQEKAKRLAIFMNTFAATWTKLVKRDFLVKNEIVFPEIKAGGDVLWDTELTACAERFLRLPTAIYFWRQDAVDSVTHGKKSTDKQIALWCSVFVSAVSFIDDLFKRMEFFKQNPNTYNIVLNNFFNSCFNSNFEARLQVDSEKIFEILTKDFAEKNLDADSTVPFLFSVIDSLQKNLIALQQQNAQPPAQIQKRIAELEKRDRYNKSYIAELEKFVADSQRRIAALEGRQ